MTLDEAKNFVAQKHGHLSWYNWIHDISEITGNRYIPERFHDEAAELYADQYRRLAKDCAYRYQQLHTHHYGFEDKETPKDASIPEGKSIFDRWKDCEA